VISGGSVVFRRWSSPCVASLGYIFGYTKVVIGALAWALAINFRD
jgi:hypothetical protein